MKKIPPSERIRKQIEALFAGEGWQDQVDLISKVLYLGAQQLAQEVLEQEVTGHLGRGYYERHKESQEHLSNRNGYREARVDIAEGRIPLQVPQVRQSPEPYNPS
jgi:transposase-like protein